jgi:hypothetical protein
MRLALVLAAAVLASIPSDQGREDAFVRLRVSTDVAWMERLASDTSAADAEAPPGLHPKKLRQAAYLRLGELGTPAALAAARRVEAEARTGPLVPVSVSLDRMPHPSGHFSDGQVEPFAQVTAPGGLTYALIALDRLGGLDVFLMTSRTPADRASWSRPLLVPDRAPDGIAEPKLSWVGDGDRLRLDFTVPATRETPTVLRAQTPRRSAASGAQAWTISLAAVRKDTDRDGWTDLEEERLRLNETAADSDGDGTPDGLDVCPNYATGPLEDSGDEAAILRKVFFAGYGIYGSHSLYIVASGSRPLQLWGSRAPVLYTDAGNWRTSWGGIPPVLSWKVKSVSRDSAGTDVAVVDFGDFEAALAAAGYTATLRRIEGEWFVVKTVMNWIS